MRTATLVRLAGRALGRNKMRSFLTTLGVVIGVAAVIAMTAIGEGARFRVQQTFEAMGTNLLIVLSGSSATGGMQGGFGSQPTLTWDDLHSIQTELSAVRAAAPVLRTAAVVQAEDQNWTTAVVGTTPEYFQIRNWSVAAGQKLSGRGREHRGEGGAARPDGGGEALRRRREPGGPDGADQDGAVPGRSACWRRRGSRRWARTTTTPPSSRSPPSSPRSRAG